MGKGSSSSTDSTTQNIYGNTTTKNPFFNSSTDSKGNTVTKFAGSNAQMYKNLQNSLNNSLASLSGAGLDASAQAYVNQMQNQLNKQSQQYMQNNIISPLVRNNMVRSSQATDMYNNMYNQNSELMRDYNDKALQDAYTRNLNLYNTLFDNYSKLYQGVASNQNTSLNASSGNKKTTTSSNTSVG